MRVPSNGKPCEEAACRASLQVFDDPYVDHWAKEPETAVRWFPEVPEHLLCDKDHQASWAAALQPVLAPYVRVEFSGDSSPWIDCPFTAHLWSVHWWGGDSIDPTKIGPLPEKEPDTQHKVLQWVHLGRYPLPAELYCPHHGPGSGGEDDEDKPSCPLCEGSELIYFGDYSVLDVWAAIVRS